MTSESNADAPGAPDALETRRLRLEWLGEADAEALQAVFAEAGDYFVSITGRAEPDADAAARELRASAAAVGRGVLLLRLREGGRAVGALGWWEGQPEAGLALLGLLLVVRGERGRGLAREALGALEGWLGARGVGALRTGVGAGDLERHALLRALGFASLEERTHVSLDRGRMMLALFEKPLA